MKKTGIIYWPTGGNVESVAERIHQKLKDQSDLYNVENFNKSQLNNYDHLIVGGSTTGSETWQDVSQTNKWGILLKNLDKDSLKGKKVAIFGLGDQVLWPRNFVDSMIVIRKEFEERGAEVVGEWSTEGYKFTDSESVVDGKFVGLAVDEDQQPEKTDERIEKWINQLKKENGF